MSNTRLGLRISIEDRELLENICAARGESISDFVRRALKKELASLGFYPPIITKALGCINQQLRKIEETSMYYNYQNYSPAPNEVIFFNEWDEATGILKDVNLDESFLVFENFILKISRTEIDTIRYIQNLIGEKISILRTDNTQQPIIILNCAHGRGQSPVKAPAAKEAPKQIPQKKPKKEKRNTAACSCALFCPKILEIFRLTLS